MRRLHGALTAFAFAALAAPAGAAEITRVQSSGDSRNRFDLEVSVRWDRTQQRSTITRELNEAGSGMPGGSIGEGDDLRYVRTRNAIVPRIAVGLYHDLELHFEMPYVLNDDRELRYAIVDGVPTGGVPPGSTIENNGVDAEGQACTVDERPDLAGVQCPLFPVPQTVYHGAKVGDLQAGLAWAIFNQQRDDTKPSWVVGVDVTFPTAERYEPAKDRSAADWSSPFTAEADPGPFGEKVWKFDAYTALSRRIGVLDPYFKAHFTAMAKSSSTYSNCDSPAVTADRTPPLTRPALEATSIAAANCATWGDEAGAKLPWIAGVTFGTELTPYESRREQQKVSLDLRLFADYTSSQRFYNELTDYSGRLHQTEGYLTMGGLAGVYLRTSKYVSLRGTASLATRTAHRLTGESLGRDGDWPALGPGGLTTDPAAMNPNFDWRYDAPGRRFRISEVSVFEISVAGAVQF